MLESDNIWMTDTHIALNNAFISNAKTSAEEFKKPERITIPTRQIEITAQIPMIETGLVHHEIMGDPTFRAVSANDITLFAIKFRGHITKEPAKRQPMGWVQLCLHLVRQFDIGKRSVFLAPEHSAPRFIQFTNRLITSFQPTAEGRAILRAIA